jgi:hypothetical protein
MDPLRRGHPHCPGYRVISGDYFWPGNRLIASSDAHEHGRRMGMTN